MSKSLKEVVKTVWNLLDRIAVFEAQRVVDFLNNMFDPDGAQ